MFTRYCNELSHVCLSIVTFFVAIGKERAMKKVKICGVEYDMSVSVLTLANYQTLFGMEANYGKDLADASKIFNGMKDHFEVVDGKRQLKKDDAYKMISETSELIVLTTRLAYALIKECEPTFISYDEWASTLTNTMEDFTWTKEVIGIASTVFRGEF